jgi:glutaredoxin-related protein
MIKDCLNLGVEKISDAQILSELIRQLGLDLEKEWVPVKPGQKRYKRRRISAQSWNNAELYVAYQRKLKEEKEVELEVVSPPEPCDSECATLITPPSIYIESSFLGGGDQKLSQVGQGEMFTQRLDGLIEVNPKVTQTGACDSACATLITPPNTYIDAQFLGGGDQKLSQVDKAETELVSPPESCDSSCATLITPLRPPRGWFEPTALDPTDEERSHADDIVQEIFQMLHFCESPADFAAVLDAYPGDLVDEAIAIEDSERVQRLIADWTVAANAAAAANAARRKISDYDPGEEVWAWFPNTRVGWLKGTVKWSIDVLISVKSGFMETFISVNEDDWIAPGDWVMSG